MHRAMEEAAEWFALLRSPETTAEERTRWESWLAASEKHRAAWAQVERVSRRFEPIQAAADPRSAATVLQTARERLARRRQVLLGLAAFGGTGLLTWAAWRPSSRSTLGMAWLADHHTGIGEIRQLTLADGSRAWLGPDSAIDEDFQPHLRRLRLLAGEVFIETASDRTRGFVVDTPHGRLRALGTRFNVQLDNSGQTAVAVYEGAVEVRTAATDAATVLRAGSQTRFNQDEIGTVGPSDPARESWPRGILIALDMPLGDVVAELARHDRGHLGIAPEVAGLRVYGSFPLADTDRALAMLVSTLPVRVHQTLPWWRSVEAQPHP